MQSSRVEFSSHLSPKRAVSALVKVSILVLLSQQSPTGSVGYGLIGEVATGPPD